MKVNGRLGMTMVFLNDPQSRGVCAKTFGDGGEHDPSSYLPAWRAVLLGSRILSISRSRGSTTLHPQKMSSELIVAAHQHQGSGLSLVNPRIDQRQGFVVDDTTRVSKPFP
jgi:hypothetical protein